MSNDMMSQEVHQLVFQSRLANILSAAQKDQGIFIILAEYFVWK